MVRAALAGADAGTRVAVTLPAELPMIEAARAWHVVAAGKAARPMLKACLEAVPSAPATAMAVAPRRPDDLPAGIACFAGGHPVPTDASVAAGRRAIGIAAAAGDNDVLLVLLSGGASALLAVPAGGVSLADKRATTAYLLGAGADIRTLNTVRKHLSGVKGGRLAAATRAQVVCLAMSDVVGDDPSVIGSGPTVGDPTTWADALAVLDAFGGRTRFPGRVVAVCEAGASGRRDDTPMPGEARLRRARTRVIGRSADAFDGARAEAERRGYHVRIVATPVVGEARAAALAHEARVRESASGARRPLCILSAGETTVRVVGRGKGGRNQEFALALAEPLSRLAVPVVAASIGTDGVDGPTDAAGALVDTQTVARAAARGLSPAASLDDNDAYRFFEALDDLVITGPTDTNVGDLQVVLVAGTPA